MGYNKETRIETVDALIEDIQEQAAAEVKQPTPAHEFMSQEAMGRLGCRELFRYDLPSKSYVPRIQGH